MSELFDLSPDGFVWAAGIENTFIGQTERIGERVLDEFALTHHYQYFREDLDRVKGLGVRAIRYGMPWYKAEPEKGKFDWDWIDRAIDHAAGTGVEIVFDLMHYGVPLWLENQFLNTDYEKHVADWAAAFTRRYKDRVKYYTPFNEPLICSEFVGLRGMWPPYLRGADGQVKIIRNISRGMTLSVQAMRAERGDAIMVQVDAAGEVLPDTPDLAEAAAFETAKTFMATDLLLGLVGDDHILRDWFLQHGMSEADLVWHLERKQDVEIVGTNYYPETSQQRLVRHGKDELIRKPISGRAAGMESSVRQFWEKYKRPVVVTESSLNGTIEERAQWLAEAVDAIPKIRAKGLPLVGFTYFPVFDLIDWVYRAGRPLEEYITRQGPRQLSPEQIANFMRYMRFTTMENLPLEAFIAPMGLWTMQMGFDGTFERVETPLVAQYREAAASQDVGDIPQETE
ncbi:family 1 glycosylhydrolase [Mesorhizobium sp. BR1-1-16]|uniref:family 1 glycosylhydrolase n=1 Tax=Mesorhizobium sp. BR1-1-16 TaxID=2876653 RepID=UPI001CCFC801|nr:family 1 glycosylhydrolase [Mesorhizobium sp. BR1-1-16]